MVTSLGLIFLAGLAVAVLAILVTAPAGALGMDATYRRLLNGGSDRPAP